MEDDVSRLVGIEGLVVTGVVNVREQLGLDVELTLGGGCCRVVRARVVEGQGPAGGTGA